VIRSLLVKALFGFGVIQGSLFLSGCSSEPASEQDPATTGTLSLPLRTSAGDHVYRLIGSLQIYGPTWAYLDLSEDTEVASVSLSTGRYEAQLYSWALYRDDGAGNLLPVSATLLSTPYPSFDIFNQTSTSISFEFETDGHPVTIGLGTLNVDIDVTETPSSCEPLGSDCPSGAWCVPPELIGGEVRCISAGLVELGAACRSPTDCVANSSCFDFGSGAVCTELCASAEFGLPCASGGTCTAQGIEYGVCAP
jgi:hypothetical protein